MPKRFFPTFLLCVANAVIPSLDAEPYLEGVPPPRPAALSVRMYDYAGVGAERLTEAAATAREIFRRAGVATEWTPCPVTAEEIEKAPECMRPMGPHVIHLRILPAVSMALRAKIGPLVYGYATPSNAGRFGTIATIFWDRVARSAELSAVTAESLLACVMAHETGHLLLGRSSHSAHGLMRARWDQPEIQKIAEGAFRFFGREKRELARNALARLR